MKEATTSIDRLALLVPVNEIYPEVESSLQELERLLKPLPLDVSIMWCCHLNLVVGSPIDHNHQLKQQYGIQNFFTKVAVDNLNVFASKNGGADRVFPFFRGQLLELLRWILVYCSDADEEHKLFIPENFAKAALICSGIWEKRVYGNRFDFDSNNPILSRTKATGAIRNSIVECWTGLDTAVAAGRGRKLFMDLLLKEYPEFGDKFLDSTNLTLSQYFDCWIALAFNYLPTPIKCDDDQKVLIQELNFQPSKVGEQCDHITDTWNAFFALESQTTQELSKTMQQSVTSCKGNLPQDYPYKAIREKPILMTKSKGAVLLDFPIATSKIAQGPLFYFFKKNILKSKREPFESFGKAFEKYVNEILDGMFNAGSSILFKRFTANPQGINSETNQPVELLDGILNDITPDLSLTSAVFFQTKANWLKDSDHFESNEADFSKVILQKYAEEDGSGIRQLVNAINKIFSSIWTPDDQSILMAKTVYPILVVHDDLFEAPLICTLLAQRFKELLEPLDTSANGSYLKNGISVTPLIVITCEMLESLESSLRDFSFIQLLNDYSTTCSDRMQNLVEYIASSNYNGKMRRSVNLTKSGLDALDSVKKNVFREGLKDIDCDIDGEEEKH